jgi:hypothetical protein
MDKLFLSSVTVLNCLNSNAGGFTGWNSGDLYDSFVAGYVNQNLISGSISRINSDSGNC